ncbi:MAG TPA: hypothetical protein QF480_01240 [Bacteroidales bacterium]|nr:hypothetical protein [Bacteroidales bacterium]|tara:strand:- start:4389 stop:4835 length:447 start_codon:yes stop_codon:yes gene_type:complete
MLKLKLMIIAMFFLISFQINGQNNINQITLSSFMIEVNGKDIKTDTTIVQRLIPDVPTDILLYENDYIKYYVVFTYRFKGRRAKLVRRTYAEMRDGKRNYSKQQKEMQELKVSVPGLFKGKSSESILYDRKSMSSIFVSFNYKFVYKQ